MQERVLFFARQAIFICFLLLFGFLPLLFNPGALFQGASAIIFPLNYELFEFNKMVGVYILTVAILTFWLLEMLASKRLILKKTPLDLALLLLLFSYLVSTVFSIDRHMSIFGYYSRQNGGLLSFLSYFILFYAYISHFQKKETYLFLRTAVISSLFVSLYAVLQHVGIDK